MAIEIDDKSHNRKERKKRDDFVNAALASANIPILRIALKSGGFQEARSALNRFFKDRYAGGRRAAA